MNLELSGIYFIINLINGKYYVGSAGNFRERWYMHVYELNRGKHHSSYLQNSWNKYGYDAFQFTIIEIVEDKEERIKVEQLWITASDCCNSDIGYNISPIANSRKGVKASESFRLVNSLNQIGKLHTEETKRKIALSKIGKKRKPRSAEWQAKIVESRKWYRHSEETRAKMSMNIRKAIRENTDERTSI